MERLGRFEPLENRHLFAVSVVEPLPDVTVATDAPAATISLAGRFDDTDVGGTVVRFDVNSPAPANRVFVELFDKVAPGRSRIAPVTSANFLKYVDGSHYANTFIHRSVPGFVVQGGGFKVTGTTSFDIAPTTSFGTIVNEPGTVGSTNVRGTIAMAKLGSDPNSASNQWFFNLADNTDPLNPNSLDNQNGGFTTFGRVLGDGMNVVDAMAAVPRFRFTSPYDSLPLENVPNPVLANDNPYDPTIHLPPNTDTLVAGQFVSFPAISRVGELVYTVSTTNPSLVTPTIEANGDLRLAYAAGGSGLATVTVRATSVFDATRFVEDPFVVTVNRPVPPATNAIIGRSGNELMVSRPEGGTTLVNSPLGTLPADVWGASLAGDFNGDGRTDVANQALDGTWWVTLTPASGPAAAARPWGSPPPGFSWRYVMTGDFDGNGKDDIAALNSETKAWRILLSNGEFFTSSRFGLWSAVGTWATVTVGDFDRDGKSDIVGIRSTDASVWVSRSTGAAFTTSQWQKLSAVGPWKLGRVGDFTGDGRDDLAVYNVTNGAWRVLGSTGSAFTSTWFCAWDPSSAWTDVRAGDFDNDGKADLLGRRASDDSWFLARSTGTSFTVSVWRPLPAGQTWQFSIVGDFDADGRRDLAVRNATTGVWRLIRFDGAALTSLRLGSWTTAKPWPQAVGVRA